MIPIYLTCLFLFTSAKVFSISTGHPHPNITVCNNYCKLKDCVKDRPLYPEMCSVGLISACPCYEKLSETILLSTIGIILAVSVISIILLCFLLKRLQEASGSFLRTSDSSSFSPGSINSNSSGEQSSPSSISNRNRFNERNMTIQMHTIKDDPPSYEEAITACEESRNKLNNLI